MSIQVAATTVGQVIDYLVTQITAAATSPVIVVDGPLGGESPDQAIVIGAENPDDAGEWVPSTTGTQAWSTIGATMRAEDYTIPCFTIANGVGGSTMKTARDEALAMFATAWNVIQADLTLGHIVTTSVTVSQADLEQSAYADGVLAVVRFAVQIKNRIR